MTMALRYNNLTNTTYCYLGFQSEIHTATPSPGDQLVRSIRLSPDQAHDPMLLPVLAAGLWTAHIHQQNNRITGILREIQTGIGGAQDDPYLLSIQSAQKVIRHTMDLDTMHRKIFSHYTYLTNGLSEFIADLLPSTTEAMKTFRTLRCIQQQPQPQQPQKSVTAEIIDDLEDFIDHMQTRAQSEVKDHERILNRTDLQLQVTSQLTKFPRIGIYS